MADAQAAGERLLAWARASLDARLVAEMIEPAVADLRHELSRAENAAERHGILRRGQIALARTVLLVVLDAWQRRAVEVRWGILLPPVLVVGLAAWMMSHSPYLSPPSVVGPMQLGYGAIGVLAAFVVASAPVGAPFGGLAMVMLFTLVALPFVGTEWHGITRWLRLGPLVICPATLLTPVFLVSQLQITRRSVALAAMAIASLALEPNAYIATMWFALAVVMAERRRRWIAAALAPLAVVSWVRDAEAWRCVSQTIHALALLPQDPRLLKLAYRPQLQVLWLAVSMLLYVTLWAGLRARKAPENMRRLALGAAAALALQPLVKFATDNGLPLISYGGSEIVAYFACVGLLLRAESAASIPRPT